MEDTEQLGNSSKQAQQDGDIYEFRLYVVCNHKKSQLALENLKEICHKYLAGMCKIEIIDLIKNPSIARKDQIIAVPTLIRKNYPKKRIIGALSNPEKVLQALELRTSNLVSDINEDFSKETSAKKTSSKELKSNKLKDNDNGSKNDLQPYVGRGDLKTWMNGYFSFAKV